MKKSKIKGLKLPTPPETTDGYFSEALNYKIVNEIVCVNIFNNYVYTRVLAIEDILKEKFGLTDEEIEKQIDENFDKYKGVIKKHYKDVSGAKDLLENGYNQFYENVYKIAMQMTDAYLKEQKNE